MIDKTRRKIDIALDEYRKGNISLEDYINVVKENKENATNPKEEAEEKHYKKEVKRTVREEYRASKEIIENCTEDEIYEVIEDYLKNALIEMELNTDIIDFQIVGSRNKGTYKEGSDIDVLVEYNNSELREDNLFNLLNDDEEGLKIEGITVDFNPINKERSGYTIDSWLEENYRYDKYKEEDYIPVTEEFLKDKYEEYIKEIDPKTDMSYEEFKESYLRDVVIDNKHLYLVTDEEEALNLDYGEEEDEEEM